MSFPPTGLVVFVALWMVLTLLVSVLLVRILERLGIASRAHRRRWFWSIAALACIALFAIGWFLI